MGRDGSISMTFPITAIIVSHNSVGALPTCLDSLRERLAPDQLLVVDNASTDASVAVADEHGADVIVSRVNGGFGAGCNLGACSARNDLLLFVNPDVCITAVDAVKLSELAGRRPLGLVAPRALLTEDAEHDESTLRKSLPWPCVVAREAIGPVLPREFSRWLSRYLDSPGRRAWLSAALILCARDEFLNAGGFDERLFLYYEDQELSRRYERHGLPLSITDAVAGRHVGGGSSADDGLLHPVRRAASAISSIEMVGIRHGPRPAWRAWILYRVLQRCAIAVIWLAARSPLASRSEQKHKELRSTQSAVMTLLAGPAPCYPMVKALARSELSG
jgi:N-acetylglucosaminyl-diphospho-decaprenol L-rhamnosyltransferase